MDSLFAYHIKSLNDTIKKYAATNEINIFVSHDDRIFVEMVELITDFKLIYTNTDESIMKMLSENNFMIHFKKVVFATGNLLYSAIELKKEL